jgi:hypothetical protein
MKQTHRDNGRLKKKVDDCAEAPKRCSAVRTAIARSKASILEEHFELAQEHANVLRLALNEAEALAWQTAHPHLFFPALAAEKAQTAVKWHQRQRRVRGGTSEVAFAE